MATQVTASLPANFGSNVDTSTTGPSGSGNLRTDTISEATAGSGVTIVNALTLSGGAGAIASTGLVTSSSPTAGVGYATGAGGTVTQATDKSTGVSLNAQCGAITMNNAALNAGVIVSFVLTNTAIAATDVLILNHISGGTVGSYTLNAQPAAGSATINVRNNTAGNLSEAIVIQFAIINGVNA